MSDSFGREMITLVLAISMKRNIVIRRINDFRRESDILRLSERPEDIKRVRDLVEMINWNEGQKYGLEAVIAGLQGDLRMLE